MRQGPLERAGETLDHLTEETLEHRLHRVARLGEEAAADT